MLVGIAANTLLQKRPYWTWLPGSCEKGQAVARFSPILAVMKTLKPIVCAGALVGVLDITAACINARVLAGFAPSHVLQSVAGGLLGRGTYTGGFATAALG